MYKICKTEQSATRQRALESGLLEAMLTQKYEDITVSDLCQKLKVPRKSFYRYFDGKEDALLALMDHILMEFDQFVIIHSEGQCEKGRDDLEYYFLFWLHQKPLLDALERCGLSSKLVERSIFNAQNEKFYVKRLAQSEGADTNAALLFIVCGLMTMVIQWHHEGCKQSVEHMAETVRNMLTRPLIRTM